MSTNYEVQEEDIVCQLLDWYPSDQDNDAIDSDRDVSDYQSIDTKSYIIRVFGLDDIGTSISIKITHFLPFFYIEIPKSWTSVDIDYLVTTIKRKIGKKYKDSIKYRIVKKHKFRGFTNHMKFRFIKFTFKNETVMRKCRYIFSKRMDIPELMKTNVLFQSYESNISPFLRFIHMRNIKPAGWILIKKNTYSIIEDRYKETRCKIELEVHWKDVFPLDKDEIAPMIISSYDIEADSSHGDFPQAKKTYQKLAYDIVYKLYELLQKPNHNHQIIKDIQTSTTITCIQDIERISKTQTQFEELCKRNVVCLLRPMLLKAFYENVNDMLDITYSLDFVLNDIHHVYTKKNRKPRENIIDEIQDKIIDMLEYFCLKNNTKEIKIFRDYVKKIKLSYGNYRLYDLVDKVTELAYADDGEHHTKKIPYYYKDLLSKIITRTYLVKEIDCLLTEFLPDVEGDKVIQIGTTSNKYGETKCFKKHIITLKSCDQFTDNEGNNVIVESYRTEREVLLAWVEFINHLMPDVLLGYNIFGFDFAYLFNRAKELGIEDEFMMIGKMLNKPSILMNKKLASSALGDNDLYYMDMTGIILIDLLKVVRNGYNLPSYKLDNVAKHFIGSQKDNVSPKDIFRLQKLGSKERMIVAKYCIQDCVLCNDLTTKLDVITNNIGMANVCSVPLSYIFLRGQGIKIFSLVAKECRENNYLLPVLEKIEDNNNCSFEGAIVLKPNPGIYFEPITVLDYSSLYPSSIISENLSHETYCIERQWLGETGKKKLKQLGYGVVDVSFNIYKDIDPENKNKGKRKVGVKNCRYVQYKNKTSDGTLKKGIIPNILMKLLKARKDTRAKIKTEKDHFKKSVLDGLQLAYKITANSLYGQIGAKTSNIRWIDIAASTTAVGRNLVMFAKDTVEKEIEGAKVVYGDSVVEDTPILLKDNNDNVIIKTIHTLGDVWKPYNEFKARDKYISCKEQSTSNYMVWSGHTWSKIKRVIRHKTNKKIFRVCTSKGIVDVTEDHSLLNEMKKQIKPNECIVNKTRLYTSFPNIIKGPVDSKLCKNLSFLQKKMAAEYYLLLKSAGYHPYLEMNGKYINMKIYTTRLNKKKLQKDGNIVKDIRFLRNTHTNEYVYDLETEEGRFQAGIGEMIVKNTDSVFVKFKVDNENGLDAVKKSIETGIQFEKIVKSMLKPPHNLEYEKTFWPFILLSKKRYVGNKYEFDTKKYKQTSMGIVLKRRDNADIVKVIYGGIIDIIMNKQNIELSKTFLKQSLLDLINGKYALEKLVITKSLRAGYKDPQSIAHKVLADRMGERDPGNKPQVNDRIPFIYISIPEKKGKKILQGNRIEHPSYIKKNNLKPDYHFYITNQIMKPVAQVFALVMEQPERLFDEALRVASNRKNKIQEITRWFRPKK